MEVEGIVTTDVVARGFGYFDISQCKCEFPEAPEQYVIELVIFKITE